MTALRTHDGAPAPIHDEPGCDARADPGRNQDHAGPIGDVRYMTKTTPDALALRPIPALPVSLTTAGGIRLMGGLTWEIAGTPETPVMRAGAPLVLRLPERRAELAASEVDRGGATGSLLLAMGDALIRTRPAARGPWAFLADLPGHNRGPEDSEGDPLLWLALADLQAAGEEGDGAITVPRPGPEQLFSDPDAALAALHKHLITTEIAGVATMWLSEAQTQRDRIRQGLAHIAPTLPLADIEPDAVSDDLPRFVHPRRVPARLLGTLGAGALLLLAGVFVVVPVIREMLRAPPPPPPELVRVHIAPGAFAAACTTALEAWWPRRVGWQVASSGCAMAGHLPAQPHLPDPEQTDRLVAPMVIWRHLAPDGNRNAVLARAAAEQLLDSWPHDARLDLGGLTLWQVAPLSLVPAQEAGPGRAAFEPDHIRARLAALWADTPPEEDRRNDPHPPVIAAVIRANPVHPARLRLGGDVPLCRSHRPARTGGFCPDPAT